MENNFEILDKHFDERKKRLKRNCIAFAVIAIVAVLSLPHAFAQNGNPKTFTTDTIKTITVSSGTRSIKIINKQALKSIETLGDTLATKMVKTSPVAIKNNYIADYILSHNKKTINGTGK